MQLNRFTDLGLRVLMYLTQPKRPTPFTISEMAEELIVSQNHLVKVVHFMSKQGWVKTTRGKGGGLVLAQPADTYHLGQVIQTLESNTNIQNSNNNSLVDCNHPPCILRPSCILKPTLDQAMQVFFKHLDQYTLADMIKQPIQKSISTENRIQILELMAQP